MNTYKVLRSVSLAVALVVTDVAMLVSAGWGYAGEMMALGLWGVSPYILFFALTAVFERYTSLRYFAPGMFAVSLLILVFTLLAYVGTLGGTSSTEVRRIFVFVPLWLNAAIFLLAIAAGLILVFTRRSEE